MSTPMAPAAVSSAAAAAAESPLSAKSAFTSPVTSAAKSETEGLLNQKWFYAALAAGLVGFGVIAYVLSAPPDDPDPKPDTKAKAKKKKVSKCVIKVCKLR